MDNNAMNKKIYLLSGLVVILIAMNFYFILKPTLPKDQIFGGGSGAEVMDKSERVIDFFALFVNKVLKAKGDIDFDTRLNLENSVRATGDDDLVEQWQKFTNSGTEDEAQAEVKNLLGLIAEKMK